MGASPQLKLSKKLACGTRIKDSWWVGGHTGLFMQTSSEIMHTIIDLLLESMPSAFLRLPGARPELLSLGKSSLYADTPIRFDTTDPMALRIEMNHGLLRQHVTPVAPLLHDTEGRVQLHVTDQPDCRYTFPLIGEWMCFDVSNDSFQKDPVLYLDILHGVLTLFLDMHMQPPKLKGA